MDVRRGKEVARSRLIKRISITTLVVCLTGAATAAIARLRPAAPSVDINGQYPGSVKRGPMERQVRGLGRLTSEEIHWITSAKEARVAQIVRHPGLDPIKADDVVMILNDPDLMLEAEKAGWQLKQEEANLANLKVKLETDKLDQRANLSQLESQYTQTKLRADRDLELTRLNLKSDLESRLSVDSAKEYESRVSLQKQRLDIGDESTKAQLDAQRVVVESVRAVYQLKRDQVEQLKVRAGIDGVLQELNVEEGQRINPGSILAKVADPKKLKAVLQIAETQMKDVRIGMDAYVDTRNGVIPGQVMRIDPAALNGTVGVDIKLMSSLPQGARPELSVDGVIELQRLTDVIYMDRPVAGEPGSTIAIFKIHPDGKSALRVNVKLGRASVNTIEVLDGLRVGDRVILSDMSQYDAYSEIRLK